METHKAVDSPPRTAQRTSRFNLEMVPLIPQAIATNHATYDNRTNGLRFTMEHIQLPPATHRKRVLPQGELEAASTLKLGADQNTHTLSLSEARLVIHKVLENKRRGGNKYEEPETLDKTLVYLDVFARFKDEENIKAVERLLNSHTELEMFERSQLGSLCCDNAEEAKSLIPSLQNKIGDGDLQELLDELTKLRNFTE
ncbi:uncharacterized protein N7469_005561 [Penicillium citrinum]|uniref:RNA polymerase Rpb4/RPC9 core domain-containing protein n=2 Tax=Penicillium TaxID=5073 RepID=A0A9W9P1W0_PENCI|nr:uncharacterized protein N7469_005561 [Penicillium citrinum]KAJ5233795.1 hypothetical protein N7469_005561 [Penicillium citrinum]KAJ5572735.1 hypothetical protein N7450_009719 [Penicillium hetheringtonii]